MSTATRTPADETRITKARAAKARKIAALLADAGVDADLATRLDTHGRRTAEALAGVPVSSDATWALVATYLPGSNR